MIAYVNPAFEELTGFSKRCSRGCDVCVRRAGRTVVRNGHRRTLFAAGRVERDCKRAQSGERFILNQTIAPIQDADGPIPGFVRIERDHRASTARATAHRVSPDLRHNLRTYGTTISGRADILSS